MSLRILLQEHPRVIVLASECHALIFRHSPSSINTAVDGALEAANNQSSVPKCVVEFTTLEAVDLSGYRLLRDSGIYGTLGLINIDADNFLCVISAAVRVASVRPDENVQKILSVEFCSCPVSVPRCLNVRILTGDKIVSTELPSTISSLRISVNTKLHITRATNICTAMDWMLMRPPWTIHASS